MFDTLGAADNSPSKVRKKGKSMEEEKGPKRGYMREIFFDSGRNAVGEGHLWAGLSDMCGKRC
jgi:hypothetical protein